MTAQICSVHHIVLIVSDPNKSAEFVEFYIRDYHD